jgi:hypothetical protein
VCARANRYARHLSKFEADWAANFSAANSQERDGARLKRKRAFELAHSGDTL